MTSVRTIGIHCVVRLLVAIDRIHVVAVGPVPARIRLHAIAISHSLRTANGTAHAIAIVIAIAGILSVTIVAGAGEAALVMSPIVAAPSASVATHDIGLVGAHRLRSALVFAIDGCLKGANSIERAFPSRARGVGEIGVDYSSLDDHCLLHSLERINSPMGLPAESVCWNDRRDWRVGFSSAAATADS